jgi:MSHA pilin protein MshA
MPKQKGFTLIELIVVIVILGIVSAVALPKFFDFSKEARKASVKAAGDALSSTIALSHAKYLVDPIGNANSVALEGTATITMANGYPTITVDGNDGLTSAAGLGIKTDTTNFIISISGSNPLVMSIKPAGLSSSITTCYTQYTAATSTSTGIVTTDISGC